MNGCRYTASITSSAKRRRIRTVRKYTESTACCGAVYSFMSRKRTTPDAQALRQRTPDDWIERHLYVPGQKLGVVLMLAVDVALFGVLVGAAIWAVQVAWIPFWAAGVINGLGHFWGYRNSTKPSNT